MHPDFARALILKVGFHPDRLRRAQAGVLLHALNTDASFRADELPAELWEGDTKLPGATFGALSTMGLLQCINIVNSPSRTRHGGLVRVWKLSDGKRSTALTWLQRNQFPTTVQEKQTEMFSTN